MNNDNHSVGEKILVQINKIQENGCFCTFLPTWQNQFGFMPNELMHSFFDENGNLTISVSDKIDVVIYAITKKGFILSDVSTYEKKEKNVQRAALISDFVSKHEAGTIFEAEVAEVLETKVFINLEGIQGIQGIIKKEDTNWNKIDRLEDLLFEGETIRAVYIGNERGQLYFSIKLLNEKPYEDCLYNLSLVDLLKYAGHDSNEFIGQAKQYHYGLFIENLYSANEQQRGKLLIDPIFGYNLRAIVPNPDSNIEENRYYKVKLKLVDKLKRLDRNQLFQFTAVNIEETDNPYKADVNLTFEKFTSPAGNVATAHLLAEVGKNMYSSKDRMFFELIQNADDAASEKGVLINVKTSGDYLIVRHNGNSFDKDDFEAITSAANGTKKANENKTGYKGIGFKSVFTDSEKVFIKTGGYQFKFDRSDDRFTDFESFYFLVNKLQTEKQQSSFLKKFHSEYTRFKGVVDIPWQLEPIWIDNFPPELGDDFIFSNVAIALKLGETKIVDNNGYRQAIEDIIRNPRFMLFLRKTKRIDFNELSVSKQTSGDAITLKNSFCKTRIEKFQRIDFEVDVNNTAFEEHGIDVRIDIEEQDETGKIIEAKFVDIHNQELENIPKKIAINNSTEISFAIPIAEDGTLMPDKERSEISMFAFLPTLVKDFKFPFFINANFILDPPRQRILGDNPWNFYLMQEIARCMVRWCISLNKRHDKNALNILIPKFFEEDSADIKRLAEHFNQAYKFAIESEAFILNHKDNLAKQEEIVIDKTGLSVIVGADLFCQLLQTDKCLPSEKIDSKILEEDIFDVEILKFEDIINEIINNSDFNNWYLAASDDQKKILYKWLNDNNIQTRRNDLQSFVAYLPAFQFGTDNKSYKDIVESESPNYVITTESIEPIKEILTKIGFICSDNVFDENSPLYKFIEMPDEVNLFDLIEECDFSKLETKERQSLFKTLKDFDGVDETKLKTIPLFRNQTGTPKPLGEMTTYRENVHKWLYPYVIYKDDYCDELDDYIIKREDEFKSVIQKHYADIDASLGELYNVYKKEWTGQFTCHLIENCKIDDDILSIIEESDKTTQEYFLERCDKLELLSSATYKNNSYESRILQLALSVYDEPSDFSSRIYFDGQCIKSFSVSDEVVCDFRQNGEEKKVKMSLAKLLPQYENQSDTVDKIKGLFENKKGLGKFFETTPKSILEVHREINQSLNIPESYFSEWRVNGGNAFQYLFATYYRREKKNCLYVPKIDLTKETDEFINDMLNFLFINGISVEESPFTYHIREYFTNKYFYSDYIFENELLLPVIEKWAADDKKKQYLLQNGVKAANSPAISFRRLFLEDKPIEFIDRLSNAELYSGVEFIATAAGYKRPFVGKYQKKILLSLKDKCYDLQGWEDRWYKEKIEKFAKEWDTTEYSKWINDHNLRIFIYPGVLPRQLSYNKKEKVVILNYEDNEYDYYNDKEKRLFVCGRRKIEDVLFAVAKEEEDADFDFDDYKALCVDGISISKKEIADKEEKIKSLSEENRRKDEIIAQYKAKYGDLTKGMGNPTDDSEIDSDDKIKQPIERDGLSIVRRKVAHNEAEHIIKEKLEGSGYDCSSWIINDDIPEYRHSIINPDGKPINLIIKSVKGGYIYLSATDFEFLTSDSNNVLMVWDGRTVHSVTADDIFNKDSTVNLIFDTEYTPKHYYAALSRVFQYVKRTTFAVKNPNYNAYDAIKTFGMDSKTEGVQELFDDNDL